MVYGAMVAKVCLRSQGQPPSGSRSFAMISRSCCRLARSYWPGWDMARTVSWGAGACLGSCCLATRCRPDDWPRRLLRRRLFEWISRMVEEGGYLGILALMLVENLFPPIPAELIMPLAGFLAARGNLHAVLVMLSGTAGSVLGAAAWYAIGLRFGLARIRGFAARNGRWLGATPDEIDRANDWFNRHCGKAVLGGRMIPAIRSLISIPAGVARMEPGRFLIFTIIGSAAWSGLLMAAGFVLEDQYSRVAGWVDPVAKLVLAAMVLTYLYRVVTFRKG